MRVIQGDLIQLALNGKFNLIIHGCNCFCTMGAGIAKTIKDTFPEAYKADLETKIGSRDKLGKISFAAVKRNGYEIVVVNGYTQYSPTGSGVLVDYEAVRSVMKTVKDRFSGRKIGYPLIGAGLAKGDWAITSEIIREELLGENHTLVEYKK